MKFHIEKIHLWFSRQEKTTLMFKNNMVNVVRGNSSRGKSNLLAIIDYCLMSDKPNIVEPVINECTDFYGIEIVINGQYFSICRKKPDAGTGADSVYMINEPFEANYMPGITNWQISVARSELDRKFNLKDDAYIFPWGKQSDVPLLTVSFRSFLMFNTLTENIISSQYEFLNYKFFEDSYVDAKEKRDYLMDVVLGIDNVLEKKQKDAIDALDTKSRSTKNLTTRFTNARNAYDSCLQKSLKLCDTIKEGTSEEINAKVDNGEKIQYISNLIEEYSPKQDKEIRQADKKYRESSMNLYKKKLQLSNILKAQKEYEVYLKSQEVDSNSLRPVEYLNQHLDKYGGTIWSKQIINELTRSLKKMHCNNKLVEPFISEKSLQNLSNEISELERKMQQLAQIKLKPVEQSVVYVALGQLKSMLPILKDYLNAIPKEPEKYDYVHDNEIRKKAKEIIDTIELRRNSVVEGELNKYIQKVYDNLTSMDNFIGCKTRFNREYERLELSDGSSILNYANIGSQSNYMFMHICFFLGLHNFLRDNACDHIGQFLFIDQPSVPYYENKDDNRSNDKAKLQDAFCVINAFMKEMIQEYDEEFQIILIEHADESYWTGDNKLEYFETCANFDGENALVPYHIINKKRNENKD